MSEQLSLHDTMLNDLLDAVIQAAYERGSGRKHTASIEDARRRLCEYIGDAAQEMRQRTNDAHALLDDHSARVAEQIHELEDQIERLEENYRATSAAFRRASQALQTARDARRALDQVEIFEDTEPMMSRRD